MIWILHNDLKSFYISKFSNFIFQFFFLDKKIIVNKIYNTKINYYY